MPGGSREGRGEIRAETDKLSKVQPWEALLRFLDFVLKQ